MVVGGEAYRELVRQSSCGVPVTVLQQAALVVEVGDVDQDIRHLVVKRVGAGEAHVLPLHRDDSRREGQEWALGAQVPDSGAFCRVAGNYECCQGYTRVPVVDDRAGERVSLGIAMHEEPHFGKHVPAVTGSARRWQVGGGRSS